ncbi:MAG: RNA 2',3'-cyclic phosphodiesterase [Gemmatimonadota bacterium]
MRLFIAMNFPAPLRRSIAKIGTDLDRAGVPARWVDPAGVHLTLKFLGELSAASADGIGLAMDEIGLAAEPLTVRFGGVGAFPSPRRPRVIWVGVESGPRLRLLHDALDRRMVDFGVIRETRPFRPHVTLGRVDREHGPGEFRDFEKQVRSLEVDREVEITQIDLMHSRLSAAGPQYSRIHVSRLGPE